MTEDVFSYFHHFKLEKRADHAAERKKCKYIFTVPLTRGNKITVPPRQRKKKKTSRPPVVRKNIYRPVPPREKLSTVPSRPGKIYLSSRPAEEKNNYPPVPLKKKIIPIPSRRENLSRSILPSRPVDKLRTRRPVPVPSRHFLCLHFTVPSRRVVIFLPAKQQKSVPSRSTSILSHFDNP